MSFLYRRATGPEDLPWHADEPPKRPRGGEEAEAKADAETPPVPNPDHVEGAS